MIKKKSKTKQRSLAEYSAIEANEPFPGTAGTYCYVQGLQCPKCDDKIWSVHRHDFHSCQCGYSWIDGGRDYTKISYGGPEFPQPWESPKIIRMRVPIQFKKNTKEPRWPY